MGGERERGGEGRKGRRQVMDGARREDVGRGGEREGRERRGKKLPAGEEREKEGVLGFLLLLLSLPLSLSSSLYVYSPTPPWVSLPLSLSLSLWLFSLSLCGRSLSLSGLPAGSLILYTLYFLYRAAGTPTSTCGFGAQRTAAASQTNPFG